MKRKQSILLQTASLEHIYIFGNGLRVNIKYMFADVYFILNEK
jgi:hypothetical protein